ncbi:membrane protein [Orientia tsutsugamushi]|nr:membrane protein [Orientia tsutsugamushi]
MYFVYFFFTTFHIFHCHIASLASYSISKLNSNLIPSSFSLFYIIEGNKASIFVTGGLVSAFNSDSGTGIDLGVGTTINLSRDTYLDIECSTIANYRPLPIHIRFGLRVHI